MTGGAGRRARTAGLDLSLYLVTDPGVGPGLPAVVAGAVAGGAGVVQVRDKTASTEQLLATGRALRAWVPDVVLLVDDDVEAAAAPGSPYDGVHVGPDDTPPDVARARLGPDAVVGWSLHDLAQLDGEAGRAAVAAATYVAVSPLHPTATKPDHTAPWGLSGLRRAVAAVDAHPAGPRPVVAIGGIDAAGAGDVVAAGAAGVCVVSAICAAADPRRAAAELRAAVEAGRTRAPLEPAVLTIAGSDSSGGAGIQADLKTASALGTYGASVVTVLTAQDTTGVQGIWPVPPAFVLDQLRSVARDLDVRAVKIGMLGDAALVAAVADGLAAELPGVPLVLDPVLVATSGDRLVPEDAVAALRERLVPRATVVTPNLPEARLLTGEDDPARAGAVLVAGGAAYALVKGGHAPGREVTDLLVAADGVDRLTAPRVDTRHTHGTGCTLSAGIAARLAQGDDVPTAVAAARAYLHRALVHGATRSVSLRPGAGHGPVDHLWPLREAR